MFRREEDIHKREDGLPKRRRGSKSCPRRGWAFPKERGSQVTSQKLLRKLGPTSSLSLQMGFLETPGSLQVHGGKGEGPDIIGHHGAGMPASLLVEAPTGF